MKTKYGWNMWSNGYINLYYLDRHAKQFNQFLLNDASVERLVGIAVAEENPENGVMKRTEYGKMIFAHQVRSRDRLTNEIKRLNKNASNK